MQAYRCAITERDEAAGEPRNRARCLVPRQKRNRSMRSTTGEIQWLTYLLRDLDIEYTQPICIKCDNNVAIHITTNPVFHERTKHLEIDCHVVREEYQKGLILPQYIPSKSQVADVFTKSLAKPQFIHLISKLGLDDAHQCP